MFEPSAHHLNRGSISTNSKRPLTIASLDYNAVSSNINLLTLWREQYMVDSLFEHHGHVMQ